MVHPTPLQPQAPLASPVTLTSSVSLVSLVSLVHLVVLVALVPSLSHAQDMRFTQSNAVPTSFNPAYAGLGEGANLVTVYRNQWAALPNAFRGYHVAHDWFDSELNSGFGVLFSQEEAGAGGLRTTRVAAQYTYEVRLGDGGWRFRPALQVGAGNRAVDLTQLTFGDQLVRDDAPTTVDPVANASKSYIDFATGGLLVGKYTWVGFSADHLNRPNEGLSTTYLDPMEIRMSTHGGFRMPVGDPYRYKRGTRPDLIMAFNYMVQGPFNQLDLGLYYDTKPMSFGVWYRGLPFGQAVDGAMDIDALAFIAGYGRDNWKVGYSYDITLSPLGLGVSGGSHEIVLKYQWQTDHRKRPAAPRFQPCPSF